MSNLIRIVGVKKRQFAKNLRILSKFYNKNSVINIPITQYLSAIQSLCEYETRVNIITNSSLSSFQLSWNDEIMNITDNINEENNPIELKLTSKNHDEYIVKKLKGTIRIAGNINDKDDPIELKLAPKNHDEYIVKRIQAILKTLNSPYAKLTK